MTRDYVLNSVSMDNPELVAYIREVQLKPTTQQDPSNVTQTTEERYVAGLTEGKREGVYVEYISRVRRDFLISYIRVLNEHRELIRFLKITLTFNLEVIVNIYLLPRETKLLIDENKVR